MSGASPAARGDCRFNLNFRMGNISRERARVAPAKAGFDKPKDAKLFYTGSMQPRGSNPGGAFEFPRTPLL
jgi:hypothetical protein